MKALQIVTLDNVVYMAMNNDVAFILGASLNMYEHQSTLCPNLPLRFLIYLAAEYESLAGRTGESIYGSSLIVMGTGTLGRTQRLSLHRADAATGGSRRCGI